MSKYELGKQVTLSRLCEEKDARIEELEYKLDKAKYYQEKSEGLEKEVAGLEQDLRDELFAHEETRKQMRLI